MKTYLVKCRGCEFSTTFLDEAVEHDKKGSCVKYHDLECFGWEIEVVQVGPS